MLKVKFENLENVTVKYIGGTDHWQGHLISSEMSII
jgi:hypothetical protein